MLSAHVLLSLCMGGWGGSGWIGDALGASSGGGLATSVIVGGALTR
jgi:hypothetical protein